MARTFLLIAAVVCFNSLGNLSLAWGMRHVSVVMGLDPLQYLQAMVNPFVAMGIILLILWLLTRMALLSWADLSFVIPLTSFGYVLAAVLGVWFLSETVSPIHWLGTLLIFAGTTIVGATNPKTELKSTEARS